MEKDLFGRTPIHAVCMQGDAERLSHVVGNHDPSAKDRYGLTGLHYAVLGGHQACVEVLHRASPDAFLRGLTQDCQQSADDGDLQLVELNPKDKAPSGNLTLSADLTEAATNMGWGSVRTKAGIRLGDVGKTFYYEARVASGGIIQIGWATKKCRLSETEGVGDDRHSWAWDGFRKRIWHAGGSIIFHHTPLWETNDVVTPYATIVEIFKAEDDQEGRKERMFARVQMGARINGKDLGLESTVQLPIESKDDLLYPGVSLVRAEAVALNFGYQPFAHAMPGWVSVAEAVPSWGRVREHVPLLAVPYPAASPLHFAAASGHTAILQFLFANTPAEMVAELLELADAEGRIPFHVACRYQGTEETLRCLLDQQEKANAHRAAGGKARIDQLAKRDKFGRMSLIHACDQPRPEVVRFLLEAGVDPNQADGESVSALAHAIDHDCAPIVSVLMDYGVDVEERDHLQDTAITFAAKNGALECIKLLVSRGADLSARDQEGSTILLASLINGYAPIVKYLLSAGISKATERNNEGDSAFLTTCRTSSVECAELLLAHGALLHDKDDHLTDGLMYAASGKNPEMVRWLIGKGLDVNEVNRDRQTALCFAAGYGPVENLRILLEHGADPNHKRVDGRTPFLIAALSGREEICRFLLLNGHASLNDHDATGNSAILLASKTGSIDCIRFLLEHGADPNEGDMGNTTPLLFACSEGELELVELLLSHGANPRTANGNGYTPLLAACLAGKLDIIKYLLSHGYSSIEERDRVRGSPLLHACREGSVECIEFLLARGASLDETDVNGATPLMYAANNNNVALIEWLVDVKKVDIHTQVNGWPAVIYAIARGHAGAARSLMDRGAKVTVTDPALPPPLAQACASGSQETVRMLLEKGLSFGGDAKEDRMCIEATLGSWSVPFCRFVFRHFEQINLSAGGEGGPEDPHQQAGLNDAAVEVLCNALRVNETVELVDLSENRLADTAVPFFVEMLAANHHLAALNLKGNSFTLDGAEALVAQLRKRNHSLLKLEIDLDGLISAPEPAESEPLDMPQDRDTRVAHLRASLESTLARNRNRRRQVATAAIQMLNVARLLLQPPPVTQFSYDSLLAELPTELLEAIVAGVDGGNVLTFEERRRVVAFALDVQGTLGKTREQFLRQCLVTLTWWPDEAEKKRKREAEEQERKRRKAEEEAKEKEESNKKKDEEGDSGEGGSRWQKLLRFFK